MNPEKKTESASGGVPPFDDTRKPNGIRFDIGLDDLKEMRDSKFSIKQLLERTLKSRLPGFTLGSPALSPSGKFLISACDNVDADADVQYMVMMDVSGLCGNVRGNPIRNYLKMPQYASWVCWASPEVVICATGAGNISLVNVSSEEKMTIVGDANGVHTDTIREIATMPGNPQVFASGGFDRRLCLVDLNRRHVLQKLDTAQVVGSVKWGELNGACVSATVDNGKFYLFDIRTTWAKPSVSINTNMPDLYTSERFSEFDLLLGFGGGRISHVDLRSRKTLTSMLDPYVEGVGGISYNFKADAFVTSGINDFTVWKYDRQTCGARIWNHSIANKDRIVNPQIYTVGAIWSPEDHELLFATDSLGCAKVYLQNWDAM